VFIKVKVFAGSKNESVAKIAGDKLEIKVIEKAKMGQANNRVRELLARYFGVAEGKVRLIKGGRKPNKIFNIKIISELRT
jgi:uncharacterized protein YggU (UPF0235/DUF167 family)